jgi:8-oxo-dGTP pyrophosphatase MutT (NUDIX family)
VRLSLTTLQRRIADHLRRAKENVAAPPEVAGDAGLTQWAAVAVILVPEPDSLLLIRRAERLGDPWSGHVGLPGGRVEPVDEDLGTTAIRETVEEVGVSLPPERLLGALPDVWPRTPIPRLLVVRPFVFALPSRPPMVLSGEVAEAFWVPLAELTRPEIYRETAFHLRGEDRLFPAYHLSQGVVWGITERILTSILSI